MLLREFCPTQFAKLAAACRGAIGGNLSRTSIGEAFRASKRAFSSKDSSSSNGNDEDEDADDVKGGLGDPSNNDDEGGGPNGGAPDLIKTDGEDTSELLSKVESIQGALVQPGIPRPPIMLALKVSKPVLPGVMHHMFVSDAAWIKALREQAKDRVFYVGAFWEKTSASSSSLSDGIAMDAGISEDDLGAEDIDAALARSQEGLKEGDSVHVNPAAEEKAKAQREAQMSDEERAAAEEAEREKKLGDMLNAFNKEDDGSSSSKKAKDKESDADEKKSSKEKDPKEGASSSSPLDGKGSRVSPLALAEMQSVGTMCRVYWQQSVLSDAPIMLALIGLHRVRATGAVEKSSPLMVKVEHHTEPAFVKGDPLKAHAREIHDLLRSMFETQQSPELGRFLHNADWNSSFLPDLAVYHLQPDNARLQTMLETFEMNARYKRALDFIKKEIEVIKLQHEIRKETMERFNEMNRKVMLMEQYKRIRKELGLNKDEKSELAKKYIERLRRKPVPKETMAALKEQFEKLASLEPSSPEYGIVRTYLDWLTELPWGQYTPDNFDMKKAQEVLDADHYGMEKVKERILEFIAVGQLRKTASHGKILCLIGPPGVGKTSIGKSIARALDRQFYRIAVGGLHDVSEIKGHRRTYIGAMPGKLIQGLKATKSSNPVILIDEIDKIAPHGRHDPSAAFLEVLDPEQNKNFMDHYLDVPYDLSKVLFVCTANLDDTIPGPLADRMEFIRLSGYVMNEKVQIARQYLVPVAERQTGVQSSQLRLEDSAIQALIKGYCREAGVRNLQKHVEQIYRKAAYQIVVKGVEKAAAEADEATQEGLKKKGIDPASITPSSSPSAPCVVVTEENLHKFVGSPIFTSERIYDQLLPGVTTGLAWTAMGGSTLYTECVIADANASQGSLKASGHLKDVIRESSEVAYTVAKAYLAKLDPNNDFFRRSALHLHLPEGGTPKDGPSAGITITCSLLSLALNCPVRSDVAMTGEITLTGRVLPIGGVKEKTIGARRTGIKTLIFPKQNKKDWDELPAFITEGMEAHFVEWYDEVFAVAFPKEVVEQANRARELTRLAALEEYRKNASEASQGASLLQKEVAKHDAEDAAKPEQKTKKKGTKKGKTADTEESNDSKALSDNAKKKNPTFVVPPRFAFVGTPPEKLQAELVHLELDHTKALSSSLNSSASSSSSTSASASESVPAHKREL